MSATEQAAADDATVRGEATDQDRQATDTAREATALAAPGDFTLPARHRWDTTQTEVIKRTVAKDCNRDELAMFLEVAARYQLDPFLRELFAAKFNGSNGPVTIFAGRDGLLKAAKITGRFRHMESAVVREKDEYEVTVDTSQVSVDEDSGKVLHRLRSLRHVRRGMGTEARGAIVGAYALVYLHGDEEPWFAEATWEDYGATKQQTNGGKDTNWTLAKGYTEAMMVKVPQSIALRMGCGLSGIYAQEEVQKQLDEQRARVQDVSSSGGKSAEVQFPDGELGMTLEALFSRANELVPGSWRTPKQAINVNGKTTEELEALASRLRRFIASRAPDDPLADDPKITDAVVVEDPPEEPAPSVDTSASASPADVPADAPAEEAGPTVAQEMGAATPTMGEQLAGGPEAAVDASAEELPADGEELPEFDAVEYAQLEHAIADLELSLEDSEEGSDAHRVYVSNLADARARYSLLRRAKAAAERGGAQ